jgi:hypothetical protein
MRRGQARDTLAGEEQTWCFRRRLHILDCALKVERASRILPSRFLNEAMFSCVPRAQWDIQALREFFQHPYIVNMTPQSDRSRFLLTELSVTPMTNNEELHEHLWGVLEPLLPTECIHIPTVTRWLSEARSSIFAQLIFEKYDNEISFRPTGRERSAFAQHLALGEPDIYQHLVVRIARNAATRKVLHKALQIYPLKKKKQQKKLFLLSSILTLLPSFRSDLLSQSALLFLRKRRVDVVLY